MQSFIGFALACMALAVLASIAYFLIENVHWIIGILFVIGCLLLYDHRTKVDSPPIHRDWVRPPARSTAPAPAPAPAPAQGEGSVDHDKFGNSRPGLPALTR